MCFCFSISYSVPSEFNSFFAILLTGTVVLQATILTAVAVVGLTLFTFWAANRGYDFIFMGPFLFTSLLVLLAYMIIQVLCPPACFTIHIFLSRAVVKLSLTLQFGLPAGQMFVPLGRVGVTIYGCLATVLFSAFIVFDTNLLVKHHTYNEYVVAAIALYLDVINLFMAQLSLSAIQ